MPALIGKESKQRELIDTLQKSYEHLARLHHISLGDFPDVQRMQQLLAVHNFKNFPNLQPRLIKAVDDMLNNDVAKLMQMIPKVCLCVLVWFKSVVCHKNT